jgi:hypothetical protein
MSWLNDLGRARYVGRNEEIEKRGGSFSTQGEVPNNRLPGYALDLEKTQGVLHFGLDDRKFPKLAVAPHVASNLLEAGENLADCKISGYTVSIL